MSTKRALIVIFLVSPSVFAESEFEEWVAIADTSVAIQASEPAADGKQCIMAAGEVQAIGDGKKLSEFTRETFGWVDSFYLLQTINARDYRGKHVHVSAFVRADPSRGLSLIKRYKEIYAVQLGEHRRVISRSMETRFDNLVELSEVTLVAFLHGHGGVTKYTAIGGPVKTADDWRRLNIEIAVGSDIDALSIGYYQRGVITGYVDHFAIVEHGPISQTKGVPLYDKLLAGKLSALQKENAEKYEFTNMSFER